MKDKVNQPKQNERPKLKQRTKRLFRWKDVKMKSGGQEKYGFFSGNWKVFEKWSKFFEARKKTKTKTKKIGRMNGEEGERKKEKN